MEKNISQMVDNMKYKLRREQTQGIENPNFDYNASSSPSPPQNKEDASDDKDDDKDKENKEDEKTNID